MVSNGEEIMEIDISEPKLSKKNIKCVLPCKKYKYETNSNRRKHVRKILMKRLKGLLDEYIIRTGQQISIITCNTSGENLQVFGAEPLKSSIKTHSSVITEEFHTAMNSSLPQETSTDNQILPDLIFEGEQKTIDQLTEVNLRSFIPLMLKYATGRGKPGWGRPDMKPEWWPDIAPWANVRSDVRTAQAKETIPWKTVLKEVIKCCYQFYNEENLLYVENAPKIITSTLQLKTEAPNLIPYFYILPTDDNIENGKPIFDLTSVVNYCQENHIDSFIIQAPNEDVALE